MISFLPWIQIVQTPATIIRFLRNILVPAFRPTFPLFLVGPYARDRHRHVAGLPGELPSNLVVVGAERDLAGTASALIDYVRYRTQPDRAAVEQQTVRPLVLGYGLMQKHERLQHGRLARGIGAGEQGQRAQGKL